MTAKTVPPDRRFDLDPYDSASWRRYLDAAVDRGLAELASDLRRVPGDIGGFLEGDLDVHAVAMAGVLLSIEEDKIPRERQDALYANLQQFLPALAEVAEEEDRKDLEEAIRRSRDRERLIEDLSRAGREDWAEFLRARMGALTLHREKNERDFEGLATWATRLVTGHRPIFRWVAFYGRDGGHTIVRLLFGTLLADRMGILHPPVRSGPGRPPVEEVTLPLLIEVLLFPSLPRKEEALGAHLVKTPMPTPRGILDAAREALGLEAWGSPREPIVRALGAAGHSWATVYLGDAAPGAKHHYKTRHQGQVRNARTRSTRDGRLGGIEGLLTAAALPLLKTGTVTGMGRREETLEILVPGAVPILRRLP